MNKRTQATSISTKVRQREEWKEIDNTRGMFFISNYGRVYKKQEEIIVNDHDRIYKKMCRGRMCNLHQDNNGYITTNIRYEDGRKRVRIHRLVAENFIKNNENKKVVNHIDGVKQNNYFENLEWCTYQENTRHACSIGLIKKDYYQKSIAMIDVKTNKVIKKFNNQYQIFDYFKVKPRGNISECLSGKRKTSFGYKWELLNE